jgi:hypothetical protein
MLAAALLAAAALLSYQTFLAPSEEPMLTAATHLP